MPSSLQLSEIQAAERPTEEAIQGYAVELLQFFKLCQHASSDAP
jgi:hypothetical protein